jgi:hypothetical protein
MLCRAVEANHSTAAGAASAAGTHLHTPTWCCIPLPSLASLGPPRQANLLLVHTHPLSQVPTATGRFALTVL